VTRRPYPPIELAKRGARLAALELAHDLRVIRDRLDDPGDREALHDFRVALRRLRSWLRAFRPVLRDTLRPKIERRLKRLAAETAASRDLEVHIRWVRRERRTLRGPSRAGATWLLRRLERDKISRDGKLRRALDDRFARATERVEAALLHFQASVHHDGPSYATVAGELVTRHTAALVDAMKKLSKSSDRLEVHTARIAAKRLRYLLEVLGPHQLPFAGAIEALKKVQSDLGEIHDAQVFGSEIATLIDGLLAERALARAKANGAAVGARTALHDPIPGLRMLARRLRHHERAAFKRVERSWDGDAARQLAPARVDSRRATIYSEPDQRKTGTAVRIATS
jgi:CHAD domain-containing protein